MNLSWDIVNVKNYGKTKSGHHKWGVLLKGIYGRPGGVLPENEEFYNYGKYTLITVARPRKEKISRTISLIYNCRTVEDLRKLNMTKNNII